MQIFNHLCSTENSRLLPCFWMLSTRTPTPLMIAMRAETWKVHCFFTCFKITSFSTSRLFWVEAKRTRPFFSSNNAPASIQPKDWRSIFVWWISTSKPTIHVAKSWSACHAKPLVGDWHVPLFLECFGLFCDIWVISPIWLDVNCRSFPQISHDFRPGADFEAAKVRRAVKAAAQRVKATAGCLPGLQLCLEGFPFSHFSDWIIRFYRFLTFYIIFFTLYLICMYIYVY